MTLKRREKKQKKQERIITFLIKFANFRDFKSLHLNTHQRNQGYF